MTTTRAKSKKAAPDICPEISNKISTRGALSVVEATRQNVLKAFSLLSNRDKLSLVTTETIFSSLAGFSPVKSPKVFNNRPVNKLVFSSINSTLGAASTTSSKKKWSKRPKSLASAIVTPNSFVVPNEILDEISIASSSMLSKMGQDQPLAVLPNMVSSSRLLLVLETKQSSPIGLPILGNWADQIEIESSSLLFLVLLLMVLGKLLLVIKLAYVKAVFQSVHGFLGAKSVSKDNIKLFCVEFASQQFLKAVFLVELTSSVHLATFKITKSLVVSESGSSSVTVALCDVLLVFGEVVCVVLKSAGVWQYVVVYFKELDAATAALNH
ncbi:hypothetical protein G9A89_009785 [Geosiphon pyriformis]|nr:hypothetical protein G9A89_009785 [Geosiphon pyriformis]